MAATTPEHPLNLSPTQGPVDRLLAPFRSFAAKKPAGAVLLLAASVLALLLANSGAADTYFGWLQTKVGFGFGAFALHKPLILWINDGLMAVFFFVVGMEIKREVMVGELATIRQASLPIAGAIGGVLVPAGIYLAVTAGTPASSGWGVPMATDIAFALGILALLGDRIPLGLKVFLTALAIVDDIVAIAVIGIFYTESVSLVSLGLGGVGIVLAMVANRAGVRSTMVYFVIGALVWFAFLKSGVHATLAAVLMAFTIPSRTCLDIRAMAARISERLGSLGGHGDGSPQELLDAHDHHLLEEINSDVDYATPPLQRIEHALLPFVTFFVLPIFAFANAGVALGGGGEVSPEVAALGTTVSVGVALGLLIGKPVGIFGLAWIAVKMGVADLPKGVTFGQILAVGLLGGVGFTMALFVGGLAFTDPAMVDASKVGILTGSAIAGVAGYAILRKICR